MIERVPSNIKTHIIRLFNLNYTNFIGSNRKRLQIQQFQHFLFVFVQIVLVLAVVEESFHARAVAAIGKLLLRSVHRSAVLGPIQNLFGTLLRLIAIPVVVLHVGFGLGRLPRLDDERLVEECRQQVLRVLEILFLQRATVCGDGQHIRVWVVAVFDKPLEFVSSMLVKWQSRESQLEEKSGLEVGGWWTIIEILTRMLTIRESGLRMLGKPWQ